MREKFNLNGKVAIVTGASKGIGLAMAEIFAEAGAKVVISSRKQDVLDSEAQILRQKGYEVSGIACNVGQTEAMQQLVDKTIEMYGGIDILVNNAATNPVFGNVLKTEGEAFDKIMNVNVKAPFELSKMVFGSMKKRGGGSIINISSIGGLSPEAYLGIYNVSKSALIMLTKVMAKELGGANVRANVVCPGLIQTKFSEALWSNEQILEQSLQDLPLKRIGQADDLAGIALYLASEASAYTTGAVFTVDGGYLI